MVENLPTGWGYVATGIVGAIAMYGASWIKEFYKGHGESHAVRSKAALDRDAQEHDQAQKAYTATIAMLEDSNGELIEQVHELQKRQLECERRDAAQGEKIKWLEENLRTAMARIAELEAANRTRTFNEERN